MARLSENHNIIRPIMPDAEIESIVGDAAASSLTAFQAAATVLRKARGVSSLQLLAAALDLLRDREKRHAEIVEADRRERPSGGA
jgi:hypothetical protein